MAIIVVGVIIIIIGVFGLFGLFGLLGLLGLFWRLRFWYGRWSSVAAKAKASARRRGASILPSTTC
jgi:hypothetical protein